MLIRTPHELRIQVLNPMGMTPNDEAFVSLMLEYPPNTKFKTGDLAMLKVVPRHLDGHGPYPNIWEVRNVVSRYQLMLHNLVHQSGGMFDWAVNMMEVTRRLPPNRRNEPVIYAHAFPHGEWPSSAEWFPEWCLKRLVLRGPTEEWEPILDEFQSKFVGYDADAFGAGVVLDMAPDIYGDQRAKKRPLTFEEDAFHRTCLVGLEEACMVPSVDGEIETAASDIFDPHSREY